MTVREMIGYLQNFDDNKEVLVCDGNSLIPPLAVSIGGNPKSKGYEKVIMVAIKIRKGK